MTTPALNVTLDFRNAAGSSSVLAITEASTTYAIVGFGHPDITRRRDVAQSPHIPGEYEISSVPGAAALTIEILCGGASYTAMDTARNTLIGATQSRRWTLRATVNGVQESWVCYSADVASVLEPGWSWAYKRRVVLSVPVASPIPT